MLFEDQYGAINKAPKSKQIKLLAETSDIDKKFLSSGS